MHLTPPHLETAECAVGRRNGVGGEVKRVHVSNTRMKNEEEGACVRACVRACVKHT
jgi:hypothetical protein